MNMKPNSRDGAGFRHPSSLTDRFESESNLPPTKLPLLSSVHPPLQLVLLFEPRSCSQANRTPGVDFSESLPLPEPPSLWQSLLLSASALHLRGLPWLTLYQQAFCYLMRARPTGGGAAVDRRH